MAARLSWSGIAADPPVQPSAHLPGTSLDLPPSIQAALWRGDQLGSPVTAVVPTGFDALDAELPGGGWPCQSLTEVLQVQASVAEWRLLGPAVQRVVATDRQVVVIGPPKPPHLPGLHRIGLDSRHVVWVRADTPLERLWAAEQLIKANAAGLVVAWLPQARQEQIRRLQICALGCDAPVILCRPAAAAHEPSAAPLRLQLRFDVDWALGVHLLKRKGPPHEGELRLPSVPGGLSAVLVPAKRTPSELLAARRRASLDPSHALGGPDSRTAADRRQPVRH